MGSENHLCGCRKYPYPDKRRSLKILNGQGAGWVKWSNKSPWVSEDWCSQKTVLFNIKLNWNSQGGRGGGSTKKQNKTIGVGGGGRGSGRTHPVTFF